MCLGHRHIEVVKIGTRTLCQKNFAFQKGGPLKLAAQFGRIVRTCLIPRLHDQSIINQTSSKCRATRAHVVHVYF